MIHYYLINIKNIEIKKSVNKIKTKEILNSCIIFVSQENNMENIVYSNKRSIFEVEEIKYHLSKDKENFDKSLNIGFISTLNDSFTKKLSLLENIKVITSVCVV